MIASQSRLLGKSFEKAAPCQPQFRALFGFLMITVYDGCSRSVTWGIRANRAATYSSRRLI